MIHLNINDKRFSLRLLTDENFEGEVSINTYNERNYIYIIDDQDLARSSEFADFYNNDKTNIFIVIDRELEDEYGYSMIPYSSNAIYHMLYECCQMNRRGKCDRGLSGDKIIALLRGTKFEYLLRYYKKL